MRGSVPWMAPEMVKQTGHGRSADVWSLGATMIEMYTARYPWPAFSNNIAAMYHVATCTEVSCGKLPPLRSRLRTHRGCKENEIVAETGLDDGSLGAR